MSASKKPAGTPAAAKPQEPNIVEQHVGDAKGDQTDPLRSPELITGDDIHLPMFSETGKFMTRGELDEILEAHADKVVRASLTGSATVAERVSKQVLENAIPEIEKQAANVAQLVLDRREKMSKVNSHGVNILTAVGVFVAGTAAMYGYDRFVKGPATEAVNQ